MKIYFKSVAEIAKLREANLVVAEILDVLEAMITPGVSTWDLNEVAVEEIAKRKVTSAFLGYYDYPAVLCTAVNEIVVHGIPRKDEILKDGDIIGLDFGVFKNGYCGDAARTVAVGQISAAKQKLVDVTREALDVAIQTCMIGNRVGDISAAVQGYVEKHGFSVVRDFVGHGIGKRMHEDPPVPNFGKAGLGRRLKAGLVIAIEPMVNSGAKEVDVLEDKWTAVTRDRSDSAHFEHSVAITDAGPLVLSQRV